MTSIKLILAIFILLAICQTSCNKTQEYCKKEADGYLFTVDEKLTPTADTLKYLAITFIDMEGIQEDDTATIHKILNDKNKVSTIQGQFSRISDNQFKITTPMVLSFDINKTKHGMLYGVDTTHIMYRFRNNACGSCHGWSNSLSCGCQIKTCTWACCMCGPSIFQAK